MSGSVHKSRKRNRDEVKSASTNDSDSDSDAGGQYLPFYSVPVPLDPYVSI